MLPANGIHVKLFPVTTRRMKLFGVGAAAGALYAVWRWLESRRREDRLRWEPQPFPYPPRPAAPRPGTPEPASSASETASSAPETEG